VAWVHGGMAAFMALCAFVGVIMELVGYTRPIDAGGSVHMLISAVLTAVASVVMSWFGRDIPARNLSRRDATLAVALIWAGAGIFGGLPFVIGAGFSFADAFFEAASGFTTTGATILNDIEGRLSRPLLLWRSLIQWLGGMGIVVLFVAVFPNVGVGGKHMYRSEVPGPTSEGLQPRITETSVTLWALYSALTVVLIALLTAIGLLLPTPDGAERMDLFQAICHAFAAMSTGGFSTLNASVAGFKSATIEMVLSAFMLIAGVNFGLYYNALRQRSYRAFLRSTEFRAYIVGVAIATFALAFAILDVHDGHLWEALRFAIFMVATTVTSTGFATEDAMTYSPPALTMVLAMMFVGAMSGSTAGGIKVSRVVLLVSMTWAEIRLSVRPSVVQAIRMDRQSVPQPVLTEVAVFFFIYMVVLLGGTFLVCVIDGVPPQTAFGAMLTSVSNMGPAPYHDGPDTFARYSDLSKYIFAWSMILGRLEFFTLLALLLPDFWRR
jgi:trk system potassium uptake protein TrkH